MSRDANSNPILASHTLRRERKGLVTLQPSSCRHDRNLMWPIRSALFEDRTRLFLILSLRRVWLARLERLHVTSLPSRLRRKTENSRHFGVQRDRSFYGDLREMSAILIKLLICVESDKIPLLHKLKQLYKRLPVVFFNPYRIYCQ